MVERSATPNLVELVRGILGAANREDWDAILDLYAPDAVWDMSDRGLGIFEGAPAIRGFWEDWWGSYEHLQIDVLDTVEIGDGVVLATFLFRGPPKGSTAEVYTRMALVYEWLHGAVARVTYYSDIDEGRAAAGALPGRGRRRCASAAGGQTLDAVNSEVIGRRISGFRCRHHRISPTPPE
jgi:ketosteroid isomerase-like protein